MRCVFMKYIDEIKGYEPKNEQEKNDRMLILNLYEKYGDKILSRDCMVAHMSASAIVINKMHNKVLFGYHNLYKHYGWLGGHADGMNDMKDVAIKELKEETGLQDFKLLEDRAISLEVLPVGAHFKNNKFVSSHLHLNLTYLFEADEDSKVRIKPDENSDLMWFKFDEANKYAKEEVMIPIYNKSKNFCRFR